MASRVEHPDVHWYFPLVRPKGVARERLADALEARETMLANVSHELRSPLAVISAWAEMLSDGTLGELDDDPRQAADNILVSAQHLTHLVNLVLTFLGGIPGVIHALWLVLANKSG